MGTENAEDYCYFLCASGYAPLRFCMCAIMSFRVGQEVVCVDDEPNKFDRRGLSFNKRMDGLRKGDVYTIRAIYNGPGVVYDIGGLYLNEIVRQNSSEGVETPYHRARFRPIVKTDISIFTSMLTTPPLMHEERERI